MMYAMTMSDDVSQDMQECIENCLACHTMCLATVPHCLKMGAEHASVSHITTLLQCAELCQTSANLMLMNSPLHGRACAVCDEACERCSEDCEALANGDEQMLTCAEVCRHCALTCRVMASGTKAA